MRYEIRLFAVLRDHAGANRLTLECPDPCDVATIRRQLKRALPAELVDRCGIAVNHEYAPDERSLSPDDEIAVIPPVSGG